MLAKTDAMDYAFSTEISLMYAEYQKIDSS